MVQPVVVMPGLSPAKFARQSECDEVSNLTIRRPVIFVDSAICDACGDSIASGQAQHVTLELRIVGVRSSKTKLAHFWLCPQCEANNRIFLTAAPGRENRLARALAPKPWWADADPAR